MDLLEVIVTPVAGSAEQELQALFDNHACDEDANQAAARIVRETTED
jgi:hypothetical protein